MNVPEIDTLMGELFGDDVMKFDDILEDDENLYDGYGTDQEQEQVIVTQQLEIKRLKHKCERLKHAKPIRKVIPTRTFRSMKGEIPFDMPLAHKRKWFEIGTITDKVHYLTPLDPVDTWSYLTKEDNVPSNKIDYFFDGMFDSDSESIE